MITEPLQVGDYLLLPGQVLVQILHKGETRYDCKPGWVFRYLTGRDELGVFGKTASSACDYCYVLGGTSYVSCLYFSITDEGEFTLDFGGGQCVGEAKYFVPASAKEIDYFNRSGVTAAIVAAKLRGELEP